METSDYVIYDKQAVIKDKINLGILSAVLTATLVLVFSIISIDVFKDNTASLTFESLSRVVFNNPALTVLFLGAFISSTISDIYFISALKDFYQEYEKTKEAEKNNSKESEEKINENVMKYSIEKANTDIKNVTQALESQIQTEVNNFETYPNINKSKKLENLKQIREELSSFQQKNNIEKEKVKQISGYKTCQNTRFTTKNNSDKKDK